jgi:hypothetical protein
MDENFLRNIYPDNILLFRSCIVTMDYQYHQHRSAAAAAAAYQGYHQYTTAGTAAAAESANHLKVGRKKQ